MQIGNVTINGKLALAPMAGVTDLAFRHICRRRKADGLSLLAGFSAGALLIGTIWALTALVL